MRHAKHNLINNRYQLLATLGAGGMGAVYTTYDRLTGQHVALKQVLSTPMQPITPELRLALAHEFQALASLRHPHIIAVQDYGFDQTQQPFFTMELLPAARPITDTAVFLPPTAKITLLLQLLQALVYIHRRGIIHRDLKPGNVLCHAEQVKLLDFGLAAISGQETAPSGTLAYMAPEILQGHAATPASDLYAVGVLAYELLAGWHPYAQAASLPNAILFDQPDFTYAEIDPPLAAVLQTMMDKEPAQRYPDAAAAIQALCHASGRPLPPETEATRDSFIQAAPLIGRAKELALLLQAMNQAMAGSGSGWLVRGESGIGKSRLLQELRTQALVQGVGVLRGVSRPDGGAYHLWQELLPPLLLMAQPDELETAVLQVILPDIAQSSERIVPVVPPLEARAARTRLHLTVTGLLRRAAQNQPLLLLLEDIHWADAASLEMLAFLLSHGRETNTRLLLVGSYRSGERPDMPQLLPHFSLLPLDRLTEPQVADLCAAVLGENGRQPLLVDFVRQQSEGNTFFIVEVLRTLAEETGRLDQITTMPLPLSVFAGGMQRVVQRRLQRIPSTYQPLIQIAAVAGRHLDLTLLAYLFPQSDVEAWLTLCANASVMERPDGSARWQFSHDKLREALLAQLDAAARAPLHRQIAQGLEAVYATSLAPYFGDLAYHFGQAGDTPRQRHYLHLAGQYAEQMYAGETAVAHYSQLAALSDDPTSQADALLCAAKVRQFLGQLDPAETTVQAALQLLPADRQTALAGRACLLMGRIWRSRSQWAAAIDWLRQAEEIYTAVDDPDGLGDTLAEIGICHYHQGEYAAAETALTHSLHLAFRQEDTGRVASAMHNLGNVSFDQGSYDLAQQRFTECLNLSREIGDRAKEASALNNLGILASYQGDAAATRRCYEEAMTIRQQIGDRAGMGASLNNLGILARDSGEYDRALALYEQALTIARELGDKRAMAYPLKNMGVIMLDQCQYARAEAYYKEALALRRETGEKWGITSVLCGLGDVFLAQQQYAQAAYYYTESLQLNGEIGDHQLYVSNLLGLAAVAAYRETAVSVNICRAACLLGFTYQWMAVTGVAVLPEWADDVANLLTFVETKLGQQEYAAAYQQGQQMTLTAAIAEAQKLTDDG